MRRFLIGLLAGGLAYALIPSTVVFWVVFLGTWAAMHAISPGTCPHCGKGVKFMYDTCHHCGKNVKQSA